MAGVDSALLFGLVASHRSAGASLAGALVATVRQVVELGGGRLNLMVTDGARLAATCHGDPLFHLTTSEGVFLASEPFDDREGWVEVPQRSLVEAAPGACRVTPLDAVG